MEQPLIRENIFAEKILRFVRMALPSSFANILRVPYHFLIAFLAAVFYRFPSAGLTVVGITGTKGKSTVVELVGAILREAGKKVATLSSLQYTIGETQSPNLLKMTVPGRFKLQEFIRKAKDEASEYLILEMTSEAIKQSRHRFIRFDVAAITNLHPEHIEAHGSFEAYRAAKSKLFQAAKKVHILNVDDPNFDFFAKFPAQKRFAYRLNPSKKARDLSLAALFEGVDISLDKRGSQFRLDGRLFGANLIGRFNISNILCAISVARALAIPWEGIQNAVAKFPRPPGRLEFVDAGQPFQIVVDFAHTPDSLREVYETVKEIFPKTSIIAVLGSTGGGRDKWKRPLLGEIALRYSKKVFFTNEDPYDEDPTQIIEEIAKGSEKVSSEKCNFEKILDRGEAIKKAIAEAKPGDTVVITGKGGEQWMVLAGGTKMPWNDSQIVREAINEATPS